MRIYLLSISDLFEESEWLRYLPLVSEERNEIIRNLQVPIDKKLSLFAAIAIRVIICQELRISNREICFLKNEYGKPFLKRYDFHFSISHTHNAIAVATSKKRVGVDIERIQKVDRKIAHRFFSIKENQYIFTPNIGINERFFEIWTRKEAYSKFVGKDLLCALKNFDSLEESLSIKLATQKYDNYVISMCVEPDEMISNYVIVKESELLIKADKLLNNFDFASY